MIWTKLKVWACRLAALGLAVGWVGTPSQRIQAQSPAHPKDGRDAEVAALKEQIAVLRKKVEAHEKKDKPDQEQKKIAVTKVTTKDVTITRPYAARIRARRHIDFRALTTGYITDIMVKEGQAVKRDDVIFKVSSTLYQAKLDIASAQLRLAELEQDNLKKLFKEKVASEQEVALSEAKLAEARAKVKLAEAELSFTNCKAPFDGLIGGLQFQQGSLIKEGETLTTLSDNSVMWVYFSVPEVRYLEDMADGRKDDDPRKIELELADGQKFPQACSKLAIEAQFNNETGNILYRADFPNPNRLLRHGQTGTVLIHKELKNAIVIPQRATFEMLNKRYAYVVDKNDVVHQRAIIVQADVAGNFVIKKGLDVNDKIIVEGIRQVSDGEKVEFEFRKADDVIEKPKKRTE